ncbi:MAG: lytic murein transglycosylase, partial [Caulobacteraceae bacterium]
MDRRAFLLSTAGLAVVPAPALLPPAPAAPLSGSGDAAFDAWREDFIRRMTDTGRASDALVQVLADLTPDPRVVANDRRQPELSKSVGDYLAAAVSDGRVSQGQSRSASASAWLPTVALNAGVNAEILVAVWGVESDFGRVQGDMDVIRSLATLAAEGRRRNFAESQLLMAMRILFEGQANRAQLKGSWAGAMGQTQFTPEDYIVFAVDGDGDGRRDIWGSDRDALASTANFLAKKASWKRGESWAREVILPKGFDYSLAEGPKNPPADWMAMGLRTADGRGWNAADTASTAGLILPGGWSAPAFLVFPNHFAIRVYNNSTTYALAVGLLADRIAGAAPLVQKWPVEKPISLADRIAAQTALTRLGFDAGDADGVIGLRTRAAARAWQKARGMPADGRGWNAADTASTAGLILPGGWSAPAFLV